MVDVFIVRHGNTFDPGDTITRVGARTDLPLSTSGRKQAERLGDHFRSVCPNGFGKAHSSNLQRTLQTAEAILTGLPGRPVVEHLEFLREIDYGPDENQPEETVVARIGAEALAAWDSEGIPPPGWQVDPDEIAKSWDSLFKSLAKHASDQPMLVVTSNGIARFALKSATEGLSVIDSIKLKTGAYGQLRVSPDRVELKSWNVRP